MFIVRWRPLVEVVTMTGAKEEVRWRSVTSESPCRKESWVDGLVGHTPILNQDSRVVAQIILST